jgi:hypothetical protein
MDNHLTFTPGIIFLKSVLHAQVVGLASYPSSGNTWLRYLIEGISG